VTGERLSQAGWLNPSKSVSQESETGGRIHQFLCQRSHAVSDAKQELSGEARNRNRPEPSQVVQAGFRLETNRSYPEGKRLLLCISTVRMTLAVFLKDRPKERR